MDLHDNHLQEKKTPPTFLQSLGFALQGLATAFKSERNLRIHCVVALVVSMLGFLLKVTSTEWAILCLCMSAVVSAELMNTAIEYAVDLTIGEEQHLLAKYAKDVAAAAVLVVVIGSVIIGAIILLPHVWQLGN